MNLRKLFTMIHTKTRRYDSHPACCDVKPAAPEPLKDIFPFFTGTLSLRLAFFDMIIITIELSFLESVYVGTSAVCLCAEQPPCSRFLQTHIPELYSRRQSAALKHAEETEVIHSSSASELDARCLFRTTCLCRGFTYEITCLSCLCRTCEDVCFCSLFVYIICAL